MKMVQRLIFNLLLAALMTFALLPATPLAVGSDLIGTGDPAGYT